MTTAAVTPDATLAPAGAGRRLAGAAGILQVVLFIGLGAMILDGPGINDSAADVRAWFGDNETEVALFTWLMPGVFGLLFLTFASGLRSVLAPADAPTGGMFARLSFAGAAVQAAVGFVGLAFWGVLAQSDILATVSDETMVTLNAFDSMIFFSIMAWPTAIFLLGASTVIIQSGVFPKWIGWLGVAIAVIGVVGSAWILSGDSEGFLGAGLGTISFLGMHVFTLATAIAMLRQD